MLKSKASHMRKEPYSHKWIVAGGFILGIELTGRMIYQYTVSTTLDTVPLALTVFLGLTLTVGCGMQLYAWFGRGMSNEMRLVTDLHGARLFCASYLGFFLLATMNFPNSLLFSTLALFTFLAGLSHLKYLELRKSVAIETAAVKEDDKYDTLAGHVDSIREQ